MRHSSRGRGSTFDSVLALALLMITASVATGAEQLASSLPSYVPPPVAPLVEAGRLINENRFIQAEQVLRAYLSATPSSGRAHSLLAYVLLRQNRAKDSLAEYTRAASFRAPSAEELISVGQDYVLLGDYPDAEKWIMLSIEMNRDDPDSWYSLGRLRYTEQRHVDAVDCFQHTLALTPRSVKAENNLGLAYEGLNRPDDAIAAYKQAIEWQDNGPPGKRSEQPLLNLAIMLIHRGELEQALPLLQRAISLAPMDPRILEQLGQIYLQKSNFSEAEKSLEAALRIDPDKSNLHFLLGQAYRHLGRSREAKEQFDAAARLAASQITP